MLGIGIEQAPVRGFTLSPRSFMNDTHGYFNSTSTVQVNATAFVTITETAPVQFTRTSVSTDIETAEVTLSRTVDALTAEGAPRTTVTYVLWTSLPKSASD